MVSHSRFFADHNLQSGVRAIPKSSNPGRIAENFSIFDFELSPDAMAAIDELDQGVRISPDPEILTATTFNVKLKTKGRVA